MTDWRALVAAGKFEEAEPMMLQETTVGDGFDPEVRGGFYESWGDTLQARELAEQKYRTAHYYWATFASWSTSGGEGTARMREANRVLIKLEVLRKGDADR